jgi:hypothetical protein
MGNRKSENRLTPWFYSDDKLKYNGMLMKGHFERFIAMHDNRCGISGSAVVLSNGKGKIAVFRTEKGNGIFPRIDGELV